MKSELPQIMLNEEYRAQLHRDAANERLANEATKGVERPHLGLMIIRFVVSVIQDVLRQQYTFEQPAKLKTAEITAFRE